MKLEHQSSQPCAGAWRREMQSQSPSGVRTATYDPVKVRISTRLGGHLTADASFDVACRHEGCDKRAYGSRVECGPLVCGPILRL